MLENFGVFLKIGNTKIAVQLDSRWENHDWDIPTSPKNVIVSRRLLIWSCTEPDASSKQGCFEIKPTNRQWQKHANTPTVLPYVYHMFAYVLILAEKNPWNTFIIICSSYDYQRLSMLILCCQKHLQLGRWTVSRGAPLQLTCPAWRWSCRTSLLRRSMMISNHYQYCYC